MRARHRLLSAVLAVSILAAWVAPAGAAWLEEGSTAGARWTPPPTVRPTWTPFYYPTPYYFPTPTPWISQPTGAARAVRDFLDSASLGSPQGYGGLTIVPVVASNSLSGPALTSLDAAVRGGSLRVYESGAGSVPAVTVENVSWSPVFLMAGEIILGGKQDRVIREDTVVSARSGPVSVPVYCVEQGRWSSGVAFKSAPSAIADGALRAQASAGAGQDAIWSHVDKKAREAGVSSSTHAYRDFAESPAVTRQLDEYVTRCPRPTVWRGRVVGAVFIGNGSVLGIDLFGDPALLSALWPKLVRSYAAQVYGSWNGDRWRASGVDASSALASLKSAWAHEVGWSGGGVRVALDVSGYSASAMTVDSRVAHVSSLPTAVIEYYDPPPPPPPPPWYPFREE